MVLIFITIIWGIWIISATCCNKGCAAICPTGCCDVNTVEIEDVRYDPLLSDHNQGYGNNPSGHVHEHGHGHGHGVPVLVASTGYDPSAPPYPSYPTNTYPVPSQSHYNNNPYPPTPYSQATTTPSAPAASYLPGQYSHEHNNNITITK